MKIPVDLRYKCYQVLAISRRRQTLAHARHVLKMIMKGIFTSQENKCLLDDGNLTRIYTRRDKARKELDFLESLPPYPRSDL